MKYEIFKNQQVVDLIGHVFSSKLPVKTAYKLSRIQKAISEEIERYHELRLKVIQTYADKNESGEIETDDAGNVRIQDAALPSFISELDELHSIRFETDTISIDELDKIDLSANDISILIEIGLLGE